MKITIVFPKNGDVTARFEDEIYTYTRAYKDMEILAEDYIEILFNDLDGSQLQHWNFSAPEAWTEDILENCNCIHEENTEDDTIFNILTELDPAWDGRIRPLQKAIAERIPE